MQWRLNLLGDHRPAGREALARKLPYEGSGNQANRMGSATSGRSSNQCKAELSKKAVTIIGGSNLRLRINKDYFLGHGVCGDISIS